MDERVDNTYEAFLQSTSLSDIAQIRGFTTGTIVKHLLKAQENGKAVNWTKLIDQKKGCVSD